MTFLQLLPAGVGYILLAAHFYRGGQQAALVGTALLLAIMTVRLPAAARILQAGLVLGACEWLRTTVVLAAERMQTGQPWLRLALILGSVALVTALSSQVFRWKRLRIRFRLP